VTSAPPITEVQFQQQVTELAEMRGWEWFHPRPGRTLNGWRTPGSGTMAKGWPDLVLVRAGDRRLIFAELKRDAGRTTDDQERVMELLDRLDTAHGWISLPGVPRVETHVWRPRDWDEIEAALR